MQEEIESICLISYLFGAFFIAYVIYGEYGDKEIIFKNLVESLLLGIEHLKKPEHEKADIPLYQRQAKFIIEYKLRDYSTSINHNYTESDII